MAATRSTDTPDFTPKTVADSSVAVAVEPDVVDETKSLVETGERPDQWDGKWTAFTVGRPGLLRDQRQVRTGEKVKFEASRGPDGIFRGPEAEHVVDIMVQGFFAGTKAFDQRERKQTVVDEERGIHYDPEWVDDEDHSKGRKGGAKGLAQKTDDEIAAQFRQMLGGGHSDMIRRERQEAREDTKPDPRQWAGAQAQPRTV